MNDEEYLQSIKRDKINKYIYEYDEHLCNPYFIQ